MAVYTQGVKFVLLDLPCCGFQFMVPEAWLDSRKETHKTFYCPNCDSNRYYPPGASEKEKLERQLEAERARLRQARDDAAYYKNAARAQKAAKTRLKNRISNGVCPCCNRYFANLHRHMLNQHGDWLQTANRVRDLRQQRQLSQRQVAELIGVSPNHVSLLERNKKLSAKAVEKIQRWLEENA